MLNKEKLVRPNPPGIVRWDHRVESDGVDWVVPDGCCDVIVIREHHRVRKIFLTSLDTAPRLVPLRAGQRYQGFRLRPGTNIDPDSLLEVTRNPTRMYQQLCDASQTDTELSAIIDALSAANGTGRQVARQAGVSERTMQRQFVRLGLPAPDFWRLLGRARRAALNLERAQPLSDVAAAFGYSDQAHMTREFVRWFGLTPARLARDAPRMAQLAEAGLGNWAPHR